MALGRAIVFEMPGVASIIAFLSLKKCNGHWGNGTLTQKRDQEVSFVCVKSFFGPQCAAAAWQVDIYSFALVMYFLSSGRSPFYWISPPVSKLF